MSRAGISSPSRESFPYRAVGSDMIQERKKWTSVGNLLAQPGPEECE